MSSLQDELGNMRLEETLGAALVKNLEDPHGSANARLLAHLDQVSRNSKSEDTLGKRYLSVTASTQIAPSCLA